MYAGGGSYQISWKPSFRFPGQYEESDQGIAYNNTSFFVQNHYREYMPELGKYNRVDPLFISAYSYYPNNPIIFYDYLGLLRQDIDNVKNWIVANTNLNRPVQVICSSWNDEGQGDHWAPYGATFGTGLIFISSYYCNNCLKENDMDQLVWDISHEYVHVQSNYDSSFSWANPIVPGVVWNWLASEISSRICPLGKFGIQCEDTHDLINERGRQIMLHFINDGRPIKPQECCDE